MTIIVNRYPATRDEPERLSVFFLEDDSQGITIFKELVNRALNCWPKAPKDLKELGDMLTHGYITQDHTEQPMGKK